MPPDPVFCPECRAEFVSTATVCAECDVALVAEAALGQVATEGLPPVSELVCVRAAAVGWARRLSDRLAAAGISHRIEITHDDDEDGSVRRPGANLPYGVYVRKEDVDAALSVDAEFMQSQIPDLEDHETSLTEQDAENCPACGSALSSDASECPDCGLALLED